MRTIARIGIILVMVGLCTAAEVPGFKLTKKYPIPGNGGFDYIVFDSSSNRLYISHGDAVEVLDADSGKRLGRVEGTPHVHGVAIVPGQHRGFTSNEGDSGFALLLCTICSSTRIEVTSRSNLTISATILGARCRSLAAIAPVSARTTTVPERSKATLLPRASSLGTALA